MISSSLSRSFLSPRAFQSLLHHYGGTSLPSPCGYRVSRRGVVRPASLGANSSMCRVTTFHHFVQQDCFQGALHPAATVLKCAKRRPFLCFHGGHLERIACQLSLQKRSQTLLPVTCHK